MCKRKGGVLVVSPRMKSSAPLRRFGPKLLVGLHYYPAQPKTSSPGRSTYNTSEEIVEKPFIKKETFIV